MKNIFNWIVTSSNDPEKVSLAVKGFLGSAVTGIIFISGILHWSISTDLLNDAATGIPAAAHSILTLIASIMSVISAWAAVWGTIRKIYITAKGQHPMGKIF